MIYIEQIRSALSELKPALRKPWVILDRLPYIHATDDPAAKPYSTPVVGRFDYMESADYIMACNPSAMSNVLSYVAALKAERDAAMKDAERYRWLTTHARTTSEHWGGRWSIVIDGPAPERHGCKDALDEAIDAAIAKMERDTAR